MISVLDVGGSHISQGFFDPEKRLLSRRQRSVVHSSGGVTDALEVLREIVTDANDLTPLGVSGISVAIPGPFHYARGVSQMRHKLIELHGIDLKEMLSRLLGLPYESVVFLNDADAFLLGALEEAVSPRAPSIGISLGTGIGSAFAADGEILKSGPGVPIDGEIWNLPFRGGIIEGVLSTQSLTEDYANRTKSSLDVKSIAHRARSGQKEAIYVFDQYGEALGQVLEELCITFQAEQILIGGGICAAADLFMPEMSKQMMRPGIITIVENPATTPLIGAGIGWGKAIRALAAL